MTRRLRLLNLIAFLAMPGRSGDSFQALRRLPEKGFVADIVRLSLPCVTISSSKVGMRRVSLESQQEIPRLEVSVWYSTFDSLH